MAGILTVDTIQSDSSYASTLNVASKINFTSGMQIGGQDTTFGGMRNRFINGDMRIDQRNAGAAITTAETYSLDRWYTQNNPTAGTVTTQQVIDAPTGFYNSAKKTYTSVTYNATSGYMNFQQTIEVQNLLDLAYGTASASPITVSFWVKSSVTGNHSFALQNYASSRRSYLTSYTINSANTWEYKTITIPGDVSFALSSTLNAAGLQVRFSQGSGTQYASATANAWQTADYFFLTGCVTPATTSGATWQVTGVQLEKGSTASAFENRQYGTELALCQRYYEVGGNNAPTQIEGGGTNIWISIQYKINKRATPTIGLTSASNLALRYYGTAGYAVTGAAYVTGYIGTTSAMVRYSGFSGLTVSAVMFTSGTADATPAVDPFSISAEL